MKRLPTVVFAFLGMAAAASPAQGQATASEVQNRAFSAMAAPSNLALGALTGAALDDNVTAFELILEGTQDGGVGAAAIGWKRGSAQYRAKFSSPVNKSAKEATPFDITEGLPTGANFEFTASNLLWAHATDEELEELTQLCRRELSRPSCDIGDLSAGGRAEMRRLLKYDDTPMYLGASVFVGQREFEFLDSSFAEQSEDHRNLSASFRIGAFSRTFGFGFLSWAYQEQHKPGSAARNLCLPLAGTTGLQCAETVLGPPTKQTSSIVAAELRHFFSGSLGVAPSVKRDFKAKVTSISLPLYFLRGKEGGLTGGVRSNWRSDTSSLSVSVFVGTSLTLTP